MSAERPPLAQWFAELRAKRGLTQDELALAIGMGKREVERYEAGTVPRGDTFIRMLDALGVEVVELPEGPRATNSELREIRSRLESLGKTVSELLENQEAGLEKLDLLIEAFAAGFAPPDAQGAPKS